MKKKSKSKKPKKIRQAKKNTKSGTKVLQKGESRLKQKKKVRTGQDRWRTTHDIKNENPKDFRVNIFPVDILYVFVLRKIGCSGSINNRKYLTDIIGFTLDEEFAKSKNSVFCYYEKVKLIK